MGTKNYDFHYIDEPEHRRRDLVPETGRFLDEIDEALAGEARKHVATLENTTTSSSVTITGKNTAGEEITSTTFKISGGGGGGADPAECVKTLENTADTANESVTVTGKNVDGEEITSTTFKIPGKKYVSTIESTTTKEGDTVTIIGKNTDGEEITNTTIEIKGGTEVNSIAPTKVETAAAAVNETAFVAGNGASGGWYSTVLGAGASDDGNSVAIGYGAAVQAGAVGIGKGVKTAKGTVAIGANAHNDGTDSVAIGTGAAGVGGDVALGSGAATAWGAVGIGRGVKANGQRSVAIGIDAHSGGGNVVIGYGAGGSTEYEKTVAIGHQVTAGGEYAVVIAPESTKGAPRSVCFAAGNGKDFSGTTDSVVMGTNTSSGTFTVSGSRNVALGCAGYNYPFDCTGSNSVALGYGARSISADGQVTVGDRAKCESLADAGVAIGQQATANGVATVAIGKQAIADGTNSVAVGSSSYAGGSNEFAVGASGAERKIVNVKTPTSSTDAATKGYVDGLAPALCAVTKAAAFANLNPNPLPVWGNGSVRSANWALSNDGSSELTITAGTVFATPAVTLKEAAVPVYVLGSGADAVGKLTVNSSGLVFGNDVTIPAGSAVIVALASEEF